MPAFITVNSIDINAAKIKVVDRPDLGVAIVYLNDGTNTIHVEDSATGRALAIAFAEAAQMRETAERAEQAAKDAHPNGGES